MPVLSGIDAPKQIKKIEPDLPVIAHTTYVLKNERDLCLDTGCNDYIPKPIKPNKLHAVISKYL